MSERPVAIALEPGPAAYAALRAAADLAALLGCPLRAYALVPGGIPTLRVHRRLKLAARRRDVLDVSFVRPGSDDLVAVSERAAEADARLLVVGRSVSGGGPSLGRRLALGRLLRRPGAPLLVVPRRGRALGERVLLACANGRPDALAPLYEVVKPLVARVSIVRYLPPRGDLELDRGLDRCIEGAVSWDERIVHGDEGHDLGDAVLDAADRIHPSLVAVAKTAVGPHLAALFAPEAADRIICEAPAPVLIARTPRLSAAQAVAA